MNTIGQTAAAHRHANQTRPTLWSRLGPHRLRRATAGGAYPADVSVRKAPGWVAEVANTGVTVWARLVALCSASHWARSSTLSTVDLGDPQIVYDAPSGHWFLSAMREDQGQTYFAVSDSSNPTGGWGLYSFAFGAQFCPDQPRLGVSTDVLALTVGLFANPACHRTRAPEIGGVVIAIDKSAMIAGASLTRLSDVRAGSVLRQLPAGAPLQPSTEQLFVSAQLPTSNAIHVIHFTGIPPAEPSRPPTHSSSSR